MAYPHLFHIPVMGTGFTIDSPIRVAHLGISSVMSLVDDLLCEKIREAYCKKTNRPYERISIVEDNGRAKRTTAYLNLVADLIDEKFQAIKKLSLSEKNDKRKYFEILPEGDLKSKFLHFLKLDNGNEKAQLEAELTESMVKGRADVNIMVKLDRLPQKKGEPLPVTESDARTALRGFAESKLNSGLVLSAGINQTLFSDFPLYNDFYEWEDGAPRKKVIVKVSDYRSAAIQGKYFARKGIEVYEYRIESGLNCGGHAFASEGLLLPSALKEICEKRDNLDKLSKDAAAFRAKKGLPCADQSGRPLITVQGGVGHTGEMQRIMKEYNIDSIGWGSPFLLVPEAVCLDEASFEKLRVSKPEDLYLSEASPLGVPFNNLRNSGSEKWTREQLEKGKPGSACPKGFLKLHAKDRDGEMVCTAAKKYQKMAIEDLDKNDPLSVSNYENKISLKQCICDHLGNSALIGLGMSKPEKAPETICPGPNIAWYQELFKLEQMVGHIYGRENCLAEDMDRPHIFATEVRLYREHLDRRMASLKIGDDTVKAITKYIATFKESLDYCDEVSKLPAYEGEKLDTIPVETALTRTHIESVEEILATYSA